ncbi:MAG: hypothetical protein ACREO4_13650, partial [Lysobacter sp.]
MAGARGILVVASAWADCGFVRASTAPALFPSGVVLGPVVDRRVEHRAEGRMALDAVIERVDQVGQLRFGEFGGSGHDRKQDGKGAHRWCPAEMEPALPQVK